MRAYSNVHRSESRNARWACIESDIIRERIQIIKVNESPQTLVSRGFFPPRGSINKTNETLRSISYRSRVSVRCCAYVVDNVSFPRIIRKIHDKEIVSHWRVGGGGWEGGGKVGWFFFAPVPLSCDIPLRHNGEKTERRDKLKISKKFLANKNLRFVRLLFLKSLSIIVLARLR